MKPKTNRDSHWWNCSAIENSLADESANRVASISIGDSLTMQGLCVSWIRWVAWFLGRDNNRCPVSFYGQYTEVKDQHLAICTHQVATWRKAKFKDLWIEWEMKCLVPGMGDYWSCQSLSWTLTEIVIRWRINTFKYPAHKLQSVLFLIYQDSSTFTKYLILGTKISTCS